MKTRALGIATLAAAFAAVVAAPAAAEPVAKPTFTKDIAPIFQEKCEACHRTGFDRADVARDLRRVASVGAVDQDARRRTRQMPPWHIDKTVGIQEFKNDRSLSDEQIETIARWVDQGAPKGDPKDMPAAEGVARRAGLELRRRCSARPSRI